MNENRLGLLDSAMGLLFLSVTPDLHAPNVGNLIVNRK